MSAPRSPRTTCAAVLAIALTAVLAAAAPAPAATSFCSPSGDYCLGAVKRGGVRWLMLSTFSFSGRVQVCVTTPTDRRQCQRFRLRRSGDLWTMKARWSRHFANDGPGAYTVRFRYGGVTLGEPVRFPVRR